MQEEQHCETEQKYYLGDNDISSGELEVTAVTNAAVASIIVAPSELQNLLL